MKKIILTFIAFLAILLNFTQSAAQNDLENFYNKYCRLFLKGMQIKLNTFDKQNGYLSCCVLQDGDCIGASERYDMAMWVSKTGRKIFGVCGYGCGAGGCWCISLENLIFYDANLNEVTNEVLNMFELEMLASRTQVRDYQGKVINLERSEAVYRIEIPRIGTTIKLVKGVPLLGEKHFANLVYNISTGKFSIVPIN
ncbi:MAG: hypothetical protein NZ551_07090 [Microscillaceae bacterium]|nr:hypothetical protein [Microscillaceae bacterium]MDW8460958.1 hypothetical protein [Cytophagales bacterium]